MKKIAVRLTDYQAEQLSPLFDEVTSGTLNEKPVMLIAQIHQVGGQAVMMCGIIPHEKALKIQEALGSKAGRSTNGKYILRKLD